MSARCFLKPGEMYFGSGVRVETLLGSCVAIALWYPQAGKGGICHFMLPERQRRLFSHSRELDGRYGREAWIWLQQQSRAQGLALDTAQVKLFGGAHVLQGQIPDRSVVDVGRRNIEVADACLAEAGLIPVARDVGGDGHRVLRFDLLTGDVWVRRGIALPRAGDKELAS